MNQSSESSAASSMSGAQELLKIGAFAELAETNLRTLRYYEEVGLLRPAARSSGGFRYYHAADLNRIRLIRDLQGLGLTLEGIGDLLVNTEKEESRNVRFAKIQKTIDAHSELLEERIKALEVQRERSQEARKKLIQCSECESTPSAENNYCEPCGLSGNRLPELLSGVFRGN